MGELYRPKTGLCWSTHKQGFQALIDNNRIVKSGETLGYKLYFDDYPITKLNSSWLDTGPAFSKSYVVETSQEVIKRCMMLSTNPGDLVLDITCGSGTTAVVSEDYGRRWITCDTSRISLSIAKKRLMTTQFNFYNLAHPNEGVSSGFNYQKVPHITLGSIANNLPEPYEILQDQPKKDNKKNKIQKMKVSRIIINPKNRRNWIIHRGIPKPCRNIC